MEYTVGDFVRMGFGFDNPNHAAAFLCAVLPFCWGWRVRPWLGGVRHALTYEDRALEIPPRTADGRVARPTLPQLVSAARGAFAPVEFGYDAYGLPVSVTDRDGRTTACDRDALGRVIGERYADGSGVAYAYDALGRLASVVDENGHEIRFGWDRLGLSRRTTAAGQVTDYVRDDDGLVAEIVSSQGGGTDRTIRRAYDEFDRVTRVDYGGGATTRYAYDAAGRLVREGDRTYRYGYLDKVLAVTEGERKYTYDYHPDGQLARADYGGGRTEDFEWDGLALVRRGGERFVNEPHIGGGNPVISSKGVTYLNDALGTTVGARRGARYSAAALTAFGEGGGRHAFFTGRPLVEGLGRAFLMRNYRADLAKWQTADPLGYPDGWNPPTYCGNRVTMLIDVKGLSIFDFYFDDGQGKVIFNKWIEGGGEDYICWDDPFWSDYMRENQLLRRQVYDFLYADARGRFSGGVYDGSFHAEIENGYKTGYEMLHGTNQDKGDFQLSGIVSVEFLDGKRIVKYDVWEVWNDIIDPNPIYYLDRAYFKILSTLYNPKDYDIQLAWRREWTFVFE